jgi:hypothetical protein
LGRDLNRIWPFNALFGIFVVITDVECSLHETVRTLSSELLFQEIISALLHKECE